MDPRRAGSRKLLLGAGWIGLGLIALGLWVFQHSRGPAPLDLAAPSAPEISSAERAPVAPAPSDEAPARAMSLPNGAPTHISCDDAQRVTTFLQRELAAPPIAPTAAEFAELWGGMLDPHGLWSAAPDSPLASVMLQAAPDMLGTLHDQVAGCAGAERVARAWEPWQKSLLAVFDQAFDTARARAPLADAEVFRLGAEPIFEDDPVTRSAVELSRELGQRLGAFAARFPEEAALVEQARARFFPTGLEALRDIVALSALRAYVPLVDPHGDFAPLDEEWALYAGDDTLDAGSPLWGGVTRTPLGARVTDDPAPPLQLDDLVLTINGLTLSGASIDQIEQAARSDAEHGGFELRVLRQGEPALLSLRASEQPPSESQELDVERIRYGRDDQIVLRVVIPDVGDSLGQDLADVLARETPGTSAVLLDLRGNGGGSLDAAVESLGLLLPGKRLFPLIHRGAVSEVLQAPGAEHPYLGPVAAFVDGDTASAAEMLAGALQAYGRGTLVGAHTFGKGCVQEYFDDVVASGVLRMTTLQFVMPNGHPLQQIGLSPELLLPLAPALERESQITRQPITFDGPDVRGATVAVGPAWPHASAPPGPCEDPLVCLALARLSGVRPGAAAGRGPNQSEGAARAARSRAGTR